MTASLQRPDRRQFLQQASALSGALVLGFQAPAAMAAGFVLQATEQQGVACAGIASGEGTSESAVRWH